jgi:GDP-4-dehydro-6-deoxy-D-mannose reductase
VRVFVTGAGGFVGRWLQLGLTRAAHDVVATDQEVDVADPGVLGAAVASARPDAVIHLAAQSSVVDSHSQARSVYRVNFLGGRTLLAATAQHAPHARILLVGSGQTYGPASPQDPPFDEASPLRPDSPYARSKAAADLLGASWARQGLDVVRVRPFNHTGPGQSEAFVASSFARQIAEIELGQRPPRLLVGNLDAVRDFLDVEDVVDAYLKLLDPDVPASAYNVARGVGASIRELLEGLLGRAQVRPEIEVEAERLRAADARVGCARRLHAATGWRPSVSLSETLARLLEDWRVRLTAAS